MQKYRISLLDVPPAGKDFTLDDPAIWQEPLQEFGMDCRVLEPLKADIHVFPLENGCLVRGALKGQVALPCNRCAEDALIDISASFEDFEDIPGPGEDVSLSPQEPSPGAERIVFDGPTPMLDLAAVCWEEFMLALPVTPLCKPDCKGLCPQCGADRNRGICSCAPEEGDPRLAILRGLKVHKQ